MIALPLTLQPPVAPTAIAQQPVQGIRTDNLQVRPVPQLNQVFQTKASNSVAVQVEPRSQFGLTVSNNVVANDTNSSNADKTTGQSTVSQQAAPNQNPIQDSPQATQQQQNNSGNEQSTNDNSEQSKENAQQQDSAQQKVEKAQQVQDQKIIQILSSRDREVRAHEQAHATVGGNLTGPPNFSYTKGPNGRLYATGGEVSISTSTSGTSDPRASISKLEKVIRAALAPAQPSSQDIRVATSASAALNELKGILAAQNSAKSVSKISRANGSSSNSLQSKLSPNSVQINENNLNSDRFKQNLANRIQNTGAINDQENSLGLRLTA